MEKARIRCREGKELGEGQEQMWRRPGTDVEKARKRCGEG